MNDLFIKILLTLITLPIMLLLGMMLYVGWTCK